MTSSPGRRSCGLHNFDSSRDQIQCIWLAEVRHFTNIMIDYWPTDTTNGVCTSTVVNLLRPSGIYMKHGGHEKTRQIWGIWKLRPAYSPETPNLGQNRWCFVPCDLEIWWMTLENKRASLLCCFKLCATFHSHWWIQTGVTVQKRPNLGQIRRFLEPCDLAIWCMTLKNNRAPLLCYFKLYASFRSHQWIQAGVTVRKRPIWVKIDDFF